VRITAVERHPKLRSRVDVYVDGAPEPAFQLARALAREHGLRPGRPIDPAEIAALVDADERRRALDTAVAMLARRPRSEQEVRRRLQRRPKNGNYKTNSGPRAVDVEGIIGQLKANRLLDDAAFARSWAESRDRASPRGRRLVAQELRARGVAPDVAAAAVEPISDDDAAYRVAASRLRSLAALDYPAFRSRLASLLQRRGFGWATVRATVDRCWRELGREAAGDSDLDAAVE
jgi:regulatory protein